MVGLPCNTRTRKENKVLKKRLLSLMLVFTMLFSSIPVSASEISVRSTTDVNNSETVYLEADGQVSEPVELPQEEVQTEAPLESSFVESAEEEIVDFMVVLEKEPLLSVFSAEDIQKNTDEVAVYREKQEQMIRQLEKALKEAFGEEEGFRLGFSYTASTTGVSVKTRLGNQSAIEQMENVEKVYVSPSFQIATDGLKGYTNNASAMIGATQG